MTNVRSIPELLKSFDEYIQKQFENNTPDNLYEPVHYLINLEGKRLRPLSLLLTNDILEGDKQWALQAAWSIELFHNFTLMHDDIMDSSNLRRSKPTSHIQFGINAAILSGDIMMIKSIESIVSLEKQCGNQNLSSLFLKTATEVCEGQALDMKYEKSETECTIDNYLEMIRLKTAVLLASSFSFASLIHPSKSFLANDLYDLGSNLGMGFQIQDDWLDLFGEENRFGKKKGGDIIRGKKTILILEAWPNLNQKDKNYYNQILVAVAENESKINYFENVFSELMIESKVLNRTNYYFRQCTLCMDKLTEKGMSDSALKLFIKNIMERKF